MTKSSSHVVNSVISPLNAISAGVGTSSSVSENDSLHRGEINAGKRTTTAGAKQPAASSSSSSSSSLTSSSKSSKTVGQSQSLHELKYANTKSFESSSFCSTAVPVKPTNTIVKQYNVKYDLNHSDASAPTVAHSHVLNAESAKNTGGISNMSFDDC